MSRDAQASRDAHGKDEPIMHRGVPSGHRTSPVRSVAVSRSGRASIFDRWAASYDRGALQPGLYHKMHDDVLRMIIRLRPHPANLLDVGCGTGHLLSLAATMLPAAACFGVDLCRPMLDAAMMAAPRAYRVHADAVRLPFADTVFEVVVCTATVRHWWDLDTGIAEASRVLVPGGLLVLADFFTPVRGVLWRVRRPPAAVAAALRSAGLRTVTVEVADGYGPISEVCVIHARRP